MCTTCSMCLLPSPSGLTSLFVRNGNNWHNNGLSNMLEAVLGGKINNKYKAQLSICNPCVKNITDSYYNTDQKVNQAFHLAGIYSESLLKSLTMPDPEDVNPPVDFINKLDILCLDKIFGYLPPLEIFKLQQVCTRWRDINKYAWHNIKKLHTAKHCSGAKDSQIKQILLHGGNYLKELCIVEPCTAEFYMPLVKENCFNVEKIVLMLDVPREEDFVGAFENMEKLKSLTIVTALDSDENWPENTGARVLESAHAGVEEIHLGDSNYNSDPVILSDLPITLERFNNLRKLALHFFHLDNNDLTAIFKKVTLIDLELFNCRFPLAVSFESYLCNLQELSLELSENVDSILFNSLTTSKDLKYLDLGCCDISQQSCKDIVKFKNLENLSLRTMSCLTDADFIRITRKCKKLKILNVDDLQDISTTALEMISQLENLECLELPGDIINDQVLVSIVNSCKNLTNLNLHSAADYLLTKTSLKELGKLTNLKELSFGASKNVDDTVIINIANNCSKLEKFELWSCKRVTDFSIVVLIKKCPLLRSLYLDKSRVFVGSLICANQKTQNRQQIFEFSGYSNKTIKVFHELGFVMSPFLNISRYSS